MPAGQIDLSIDKGETYKKVFYWKDKSKVAIDMTGYTARMQVRKSTNAATIQLELTTENGRITITGAEGKIELYISDSDTSSLEGTKSVYDLELIDNSGDIIKFARGIIVMVDEVTK